MNKRNDRSQLDPQLKQTLQTLKTLPARDEAVAHQRKEQFIKNAITARQQNVTFSSKPRLLNHETKIYRWRNTMTAKVIGIVMAVLIVLGSAGMGTVAASQSSLPTEALYPLKQWSENIRLDLTTDPNKQLDLQLDFADRRVDEYVELVEDGVVPPESLLLQYQQLLQLAAQLTDETDDPLQSKLKMQNRMQNQQNRMVMMQSVDPLMQQTQQMLQQQIHQMDCEEGVECEFVPVQLQDQDRDQLREDQPEGAGNPDANGYDGDYPESGPHNDDEDGGNYGNGNNSDETDETGHNGNSNDNGNYGSDETEENSTGQKNGNK